jgi:hypothetical protein
VVVGGGSARNTPPGVIARVQARQLIERSPPPAARSRLRGPRMTEGAALAESSPSSSKAQRYKQRPAPEAPPSKGRCALLSEAEAMIGSSPLAAMTNDPTPRCAAAAAAHTQPVAALSSQLVSRAQAHALRRGGREPDGLDPQRRAVSREEGEHT